MPKIDDRRLLDDLYRLRRFGEYKTGVHRPTYSEEDMAARRWLAGRMEEAGLTVELDGIGNVIGRSAVPGKRLLTGSHSESQPHAGWLDGALGVVYAIETARAFREDPACAELGVDVAVWADEEGHYGPYLGSRSFVGRLEEAEIDRLSNRHNGTPLREALQQAGLEGKPRLQMNPADYVGFLEAHIEQGDSLEAAGLSIGVVTSIVGIWQYRVRFTGVQNHAGTTRMAIRKDAGLALAKFVTVLDERFRAAAAERSVWTTGRITLDPGAASIIPGGAEMLFQFRDVDPDQLRRFEAVLEQTVAEADREGPCSAVLENISRSTPQKMDERFQQAIEAAAEKHAPGSHMRIPSGAGHDAQYLALAVPAGMLFVPSIGGISHHWSENTSDEDIVRGARVFADAAEAILQG